jgi:YHS domain-containing protein
MTIITTTMASLIYSLNGGTYYGTVKKSISKFIIKEVLDIILIN